MEERLQKFLARAGVASRRKAEELIAAGRVSVNGHVVSAMGARVDAAEDEVRLDTEVVRLPAPPGPPAAPARAPGVPAGAGPPGGRKYYLLHKPRGVLSTARDDHGRPTVLDLVRVPGRRLYPVGRLDEDSEGLLLLTDDGVLTNLLTHPRYGVPKTYDLRVRGEVTPEDVRAVERGIWLSEGRTGPARMRIRRHGRDISHVLMTLGEGRNREVRRIFARLRHPVLSLRRVRLGPLELGRLAPGEWRPLRQHEVQALYAAAQRRRGPGVPGAPAAPGSPAGPRPRGRPSRRPRP